MDKVNYPLLYSLQDCPYAMRARLAILMAKQTVSLRAIVTKNKPTEMLKISPKGTVPVLLLTDGTIIDESLEIMLWALRDNDPDNLLYGDKPEVLQEMLDLIDIGDNEFRANLSAYKYNKRYRNREDELRFRTGCEEFIKRIEDCLLNHQYIMGETLSLADLALLPFLRQFANADRKWFREAGYPKVSDWLARNMQSLLFNKAMRKYPLWLECHKEFLLSWDSKEVK